MASMLATASLTEATAVGAGTAVDFTTAVSRGTMVVVVNGTVTGGVVTLEASHDNTNWVKLEAMSPQTGFNQHLAPQRGAFRYWRANILVEITGGGSVTTTLMEAG